MIMEVYEDEEATFRFGDPFHYDEFIIVRDGKLILTDADGMTQESIAGDSLVIPKGFTFRLMFTLLYPKQVHSGRLHLFVVPN